MAIGFLSRAVSSSDFNKKLLGGRDVMFHIQFSTYFYFYFFINLLFIYFLTALGIRCWAGLSLDAARGGYSSSQCAGFSLWWLLLLQSTGSRRAGFSSCGVRASVVVAHRLSCSAACGIFLAQGSNPCPLCWQAGS